MVEKNNSEEQLINRAKNGDKAAISELYEKHIDQIYRYIAYRVPESEAEDLTAEVFVRMVESLPKFEYTGAPLEAWLYRVAAARIADSYRQRGRQTLEEIDDNLRSDEPLPEEKMLKNLEYRQVREALQQLNEQEQRLLILRFVERKSHEDVARLMGKNLTAIRTAQHRALKKLAKHLNIKNKERHYLRGTSED